MAEYNTQRRRRDDIEQITEDSVHLGDACTVRNTLLPYKQAASPKIHRVHTLYTGSYEKEREDKRVKYGTTYNFVGRQHMCVMRARIVPSLPRPCPLAQSRLMVMVGLSQVS
jgi:hypothetical protein